jgi:hypothetical protein
LLLHVNHHLKIFYGFDDVALAFFKQPPPLVASGKVIVSDDVIYPMKHSPVIFVYSTITAASTISILLLITQLLKKFVK